MAEKNNYDLNDGRPCETDVFLATLFEQIDDVHDREVAIQAWIEGAWDEALEGVTLPVTS